MADARLRVASVVAVCLVAAAAGSPARAQGTRLATLAQQKMCADQAKKFFNEQPVPQPAKVIVPASYIDHYDAQANVCYIAILRGDSVTGDQTITFSTVVFDAFEQTSYATYIWTSDKAKKAGEVNPQWCTVKPRGQREIVCKSEDEFNELLEKYFGLEIR